MHTKALAGMGKTTELDMTMAYSRKHPYTSHTEEIRN